MPQRIRVKSYRRVYESNWRLVRVWGFDFSKWVPGGIPVKGLLWVLGTFMTVWFLSRVPPFSFVLGIVPSWFRYGTLSLIAGVASQQEAPDGRPIPVYAYATVRQSLRAKPPAEPEWKTWDAQVPVRWDGSGTELHPCRITGPALVRVGEGVRITANSKKTTLHRDPAYPQPMTPLVLVPGEVIDIKR